jgi:hypothetical protein
MKDPMESMESSNGNDDNAKYLFDELQSRVQTEPELFDWIQSAALDGLWYVDYDVLRLCVFACAISFMRAMSFPTSYGSLPLTRLTFSFRTVTKGIGIWKILKMSG